MMHHLSEGEDTIAFIRLRNPIADDGFDGGMSHLSKSRKLGTPSMSKSLLPSSASRRPSPSLQSDTNSFSRNYIDY